MPGNPYLHEPAAQKVVTHLIELCGDTFEIRSYERKTALVCEEEPFDFPDDVRAGDALIVFTKRAVLDIAGRLERQGIRTSVIYGSLPPEIRRRQIRMFSAGRHEWSFPQMRLEWDSIYLCGGSFLCKQRSLTEKKQDR